MNPVLNIELFVLWMFEVCGSYLLSLDLILDLGDFDLHSINLFLLDQRDGRGFTVLNVLKRQVSQWDVPLTVILLRFSV